MANKYKGFFALAVLPPDIKVITPETEAPIQFLNEDGEIENQALPVIMQIVSREGMHNFIDKFFDKLEGK